MKKFVLITCSVLGLVACGGGESSGDIADRATKLAEQVCKCEKFACTREGVKGLNKIAIVEEKAVKALTEERHAVYKAAQKKGGDCQFALKQK